MANSALFDKCGGYRKFHSFTYATIIHIATIDFCKRFISCKTDPLGKTAGQMMGAARSGRQNIIEGSERSATSKETEMKLTDVAKANEEDNIKKPLCTECGKPMVKRISRTGKKQGLPFWGCSDFPNCKGVGKMENTK